MYCYESYSKCFYCKCNTKMIAQHIVVLLFPSAHPRVLTYIIVVHFLHQPVVWVVQIDEDH